MEAPCSQPGSHQLDSDPAAIPAPGDRVSTQGYQFQQQQQHDQQAGSHNQFGHNQFGRNHSAQTDFGRDIGGSLTGSQQTSLAEFAALPANHTVFDHSRSQPAQVIQAQFPQRDRDSWQVQSLRDNSAHALIFQRQTQSDNLKVLSNEYSGNPHVGQVEFFAQVHTNYCNSEQELKDIGRYQGRIFDELKASGLKHIFLEGLITNIPSDSYDRTATLDRYHYWLLPDYLRNNCPEQGLTNFIRNLFNPQPNANQLNDLQALYLGALGAAPILAMLDPSISLHRTIPIDLDQRIYDLQRNPHITPARDKRLCTSIRENLALKEIQAFLNVNPGERVGLIFGGLHEFATQAKRVWQNPPQIFKIDWPIARAEFFQRSGATIPQALMAVL